MPLEDTDMETPIIPNATAVLTPTGDVEVTCTYGPTSITPARFVEIVLGLVSHLSIPPLILGFPGNIMIILIANRRHNKQLSPSIYMSAMAFADALLLVSSAIFLYVFYWTTLIAEYRGAALVGIMTSIILMGMLSGFYLTAMSVDRLIAVRFPMVAPSLCTPGRAKKVVITGTVVIVGTNLYLLYVLEFIIHPSTGLENLIYLVPNDPVGSFTATIFQLLFGTILPFAIIITCNILIIVTIKMASVERGKLQGKKPDKTEQERSDQQYLTRMLIFVSMAYVITSIPYRLFSLLMLIPEISSLIDLTNVCTFILYNCTIISCYSIWIWNYAINFYMYCVGGGRRYRKDLKEVMTSFRNCVCPFRKAV